MGIYISNYDIYSQCLDGVHHVCRVGERSDGSHVT